MKQETIGSKGTVPGFRPLIGEERWHKDSFTAEMLDGGWRPLLNYEAIVAGDQWHTGVTWLNREHFKSQAMPGSSKHRTRRPLPPPAVETFEAHGHIWYKHTPGDECTVEPDVVVFTLYEREMNGANYIDTLQSARDWHWTIPSNADTSIIGYRFPDYPAVHTTLQQSQPFAEKLDAAVDAARQRINERERIKEQLTSIYNGWVHLPPETVAECIADVAGVLYPTDADRCEAAFARWFGNAAGFTADKPILKTAYFAAWKAAKESK